MLRAYTSNFAAMRMLRRPRKRAAARPIRSASRCSTDAERRTLELNAKGMFAAMVGWTICSLFASVAFNWTFYYVLALAVAGREMLFASPRARRGVGGG